MGSVNPVFVLPQAAAERGAEVADGLFGSFTLGVGQFCTNPGVVLLPASSAGDAVAERLTELTRNANAGTMLNARVCELYGRGLSELEAAGGQPLAKGQAGTSATEGVPTLWQAPWRPRSRSPPCVRGLRSQHLLLRYETQDQLLEFAESMEAANRHPPGPTGGT